MHHASASRQPARVFKVGIADHPGKPGSTRRGIVLKRLSFGRRHDFANGRLGLRERLSPPRQQDTMLSQHQSILLLRHLDTLTLRYSGALMPLRARIWRPPSIRRSCIVTRRPVSIRLRVARAFSAAHIAGSSRTEVWMRGAGSGSPGAGSVGVEGSGSAVGLIFFSAPNVGRWAIRGVGALGGWRSR